MSSPSFGAFAFTRSEFDADFVDSSAPVEYLWEYLETLGATSFVREERYVDRHFLDDFAGYYARSFGAPEPHCARLHYFEAIAIDELNAILDTAYCGTVEERREAVAQLDAAYLGFVVRRPLRGAPIGRTVLRTYPADGRRKYTVVRPYRVHLGALPLRVNGLAYQQQDGGAAVCASTALWSALQKVAHVAGHRTPTPSGITAASGTPFAASYGLTDSQMAVALSNLGYAAEYFVPAENRPLFRAKLGACLQSHLPVVLLLSTRIETGAGEVTAGHAVTVTGYREPGSPMMVPAAHKGWKALPLRTGAVSTLYVHDDNLGSHAHYELRDAPKGEGDEYDPLLLVRGRSGGEEKEWWQVDEWTIEAALVPKPWKVRMPVDQLFDTLWSIHSLFALPFPGAALTYEVAFSTGVEYRRRLFDLDLDRSQLRAFNERLSLPRHVAIAKAYRKGVRLCDLVLDATQVDLRQDESSILAAVAPGVPARSAASKKLSHVFEQVLRVPAISGPPSAP